MLDLTKPLELKFEKHSLQEILDESLSLAADRINLQHIKVQKNYPESPIEIEVDRSKLIIAFTNLVINAIEAMETNKGELAVSISALPTAYNVSIRDNGKEFLMNFYPSFSNRFLHPRKMGWDLDLQLVIQLSNHTKELSMLKPSWTKEVIFIISFNR